MAVPAWAVAVILPVGVFLSLLIAVAVYFLWKRRRIRAQYQNLCTCTPPVPPCTSPVLLATQSSRFRPGDVPFFLPPRLKDRPPPSPEEEEEKEEEEEVPAGQWCHRGSLAISASFPLGSLRPDLYHIPEGLGEWAPPCGDTARLWFSVEYRREREELLVSVLHAANLPAHCRSCTALVKLQLLPDDLRRRQAKARRKGRNPHFNDSFVFQVSSRCLPQSTVCLSVFSVDWLKKHQLEGRVLFPLKELELEETKARVVWRDLETDSDPFCSEHGDLQVSLNYSLALQRLTVVVLRARGLQLFRDAGVCVQVSLQIHTQVMKSKRTASVRVGADPTFNQRLSFRLRPLQLDEACLRLELWQTTPGQSRSLGQVVIGPFMYARGRELDHWNEMVSKPQELVKQWHGLSRAPGTQSMP